MSMVILGDKAFFPKSTCFSSFPAKNEAVVVEKPNISWRNHLEFLEQPIIKGKCL